MHSKYLIYGLVDPRTKQLRYVGKSSSGLKRADQHKFKCRLEGVYTHKANWIRELQLAGLEYVAVVLFEADDPQFLLEAEAFWISYYYMSGHPLTNSMSPLGHGPIRKTISEATRDKIRQKKLGVKFTPEHRAKLSCAKVGVVPWNKGVPMKVESKQRLSASLAKKRLGS